MQRTAADVVVIGAGVAGCSAFYHLAKLNCRNPGFKPILLDALPPVSLTSANGSFSYRNWFPSNEEFGLRTLVSRSIDEIDAIAKSTNNAIGINRNGYMFVTRDANQVDAFQTSARLLEENGGGKLRVHGRSDMTGYPFPKEELDYTLDGSDLILGMGNISQIFPSLNGSGAKAALHVRRCGSLDPYKLVHYQLEEARKCCPNGEVKLGRMTEVISDGGHVSGIKVAGANGENYEISTPNIVFATGPLVLETLEVLKSRGQSSMDIPIINELHCRATMDDPKGIITPLTPLTFDSDAPGKFQFTDDDRARLSADPSAKRMLEEFPAGVHVRPYDKGKMLSVWTYDIEPVEAIYPVESLLDKHFPEICLRGLTKLFPGMQDYIGDLNVHKSFDVRGGYYCKTLDNQPLIGPAHNTIEGVYLQSAMSGIGLMSSGASGQLLAAHVMGEVPADKELAACAPLFMPSRFEDPAYVSSLAGDRSRAGQV